MDYDLQEKLSKYAKAYYELYGSHPGYIALPEHLYRRLGPVRKLEFIFGSNILPPMLENEVAEYARWSPMYERVIIHLVPERAETTDCRVER